MKKYLLRNVAGLGIIFTPLLLPGVIHAAPRLIGISGYPLNLYEINPTNGSTTKVFMPSSGTDTPALGFCPTNGLLYFFVGGAAWQNPDPVTGLPTPRSGGAQLHHAHDRA